MEPPQDGQASPPQAANNALTIRVKDQTGEETYFKVKNTTKMGKVFKVTRPLCERASERVCE